MRSFSSKSPFSFLKTNESIPLIIFIFIFLGVGLYFFINKLTEKQQQDIADKKLAKEHDEVELDIVNSGNKNIASRMAAADKTAGEGADTNSIQNRYASVDVLNSPSSTFNEEVKLFIKQGNESPEVYSHTPLYVPPFGTGKETRCVGRQVMPPTSTTYVQASLSSNLVKTSSDAGYLS
jgi:hypothetical protein